MAEHTPTPWVYDESLRANIYSDDATGSIIATFKDFNFAPRDPREQEASARFAVKAVNSHDALVKALEDIRQRANESGAGELGLLDTIQAMHGIARAALQEAGR